MTLEMMTKSAILGSLMEWDKWREEIPYITWPHNWLVKAVPPVTGAIMRYNVTKKGLTGWVSIYLDCYDVLGSYGAPYWEVYPYGDDIIRCDMLDTKMLLNYIRISLLQLGKGRQ